MRKPLPSELEPEAARALYKAVGQRIRELRGTRKMSQKELAGLSDIKAPYLVEIELSGINLSLKLLQQLASALGVLPRDLLPGGGEAQVTHALAAPLVTQKIVTLRDELTRLIDTRCNEIVTVIEKPSPFPPQ